MGARSPAAKARKKTYDRAYMKNYYRKNRRKISESHRAYYEAHRTETIKRAEKNYYRDTEAVFFRNIARKFSVTAEQYKQMLRAQSGRCAICRKRQTGRFKHLAVDHDHKTDKVRGLLCGVCNRAIGQLGDDPKIVARAVEYLTAGRN